MALKVLSALDSSRTRIYHFKAIIVAGMGLFTDAYDLFCIPPIMKLLGRIYYHDHGNKYKIPKVVVSAMVAIALLGTVIGQLVFGRLGDRMGRRRVYGLALMLMLLSSLACGFSFCTTRLCVLGSLGFFRFLLGVGIGGDYPLSATIMSEFANKKTRGAFIAAVFSMQGFGILASSMVTMVVCKIFERTSSDASDVNRTPLEADIAWRLILMLGSVPAALTYYWRMMMPETARYTALVQQNVMQAAKDMEKVLDISISQIAEDYPLPPSPPQCHLISKQFLRRHGRDLFSCAFTWLLVDVVFYSSNLFQSQIDHHYIDNGNSPMNAFEEAFKLARHQAIVAVCSTIPGYFVTVYFIDRIGRVKIQALGFFFMGIVYLAIGIPYSSKWSNHTDFGFMFLYGLTFFFANFGPNTTTFIVPAELFPARFRSTCHGISGACGKIGAIIGTVGFLWASGNEYDNDDHRLNINAHGMTIALLILSGVCFTGFVVTLLFTRETTGRSLEENEKEDDDCNELSFLGCLTKSSLRTNSTSGNEIAAPAASAP